MTSLFRVLLFVTLNTSLTVFAQTAGSAQGHDYFEKLVQPIFEQRCIQCHSCYNAPCQLNLSSPEGIDRGLVKDFEVFSARKLRAEEPSRLGIDRKTTEGWRHFSWWHSFRPVTQNTGNEHKNLDTSFILRVIEQKQKNPDLAVDDVNDFKNQQAENSRVCPDTKYDLEKHLRTRPNAGMPYGMPALTDEETDIIREWTRMGSPRAASGNERPTQDLASMRALETYLNSYLTQKDSNEGRKQELVSRYLFEHLFLAHIYLKNETNPAHFYNLIRSKTACDSGALDEYATRRPWNATKGKFFYCLKRINTSLVHKTHITYLIDSKKIQRWQNLFAGPWTTKGNGTRSDELASNPFLIYKDIPVKARYQFLLDDANYHVMTFIKGPVCKGNTAVNSIDEHFYVLFIDPNSDLMVKNSKFVDSSIKELVLPAYKGSEQIGGLFTGRHIRQSRNRYRVLRDQVYGQEFPKGYAMHDLWTNNDNAALTVFRHHDSSAVVKGLAGATSKTIFVLDYSLLERLVYVLVTGFDVYGDVSHQIETRLYMSYIRMEAEENFLSFLPASVREPMRKSWYVRSEGVTEKIADVVNSLLLRDKDKVSRRFPLLGLDKGTQLNMPPLDQDAFYKLKGNAQETTLRSYRRNFIAGVKTHLGSSLAFKDNLNYDKAFSVTTAGLKIDPIRSVADLEKEMSKVTDVRALNAPWVLKLPSLSMLVVESSEGPQLYTLIRNKEHFNIAWIAGEEGRRNFAADSLTIYKGIAGSYPNHIFRIDLENAQNFLQQMIEIQTPASYEAFLQNYGSPRSGAGSERFWANSDRLHAVAKMKFPLEFGAFDYNRYGIDYRTEKLQVDSLQEDLPADAQAIVTDSLGDEP